MQPCGSHLCAKLHTLLYTHNKRSSDSDETCDYSLSSVSEIKGCTHQGSSRC